MQSVESKKEEFQKYLEKSGVVDALTKGAHPLCPRRLPSHGRFPALDTFAFSYRWGAPKRLSSFFHHDIAQID